MIKNILGGLSIAICFYILLWLSYAIELAIID